MPSDVQSIWKAGLRKDLRALEERNLCRTLAEVRGINFCSNDYLGLAENPGLRQSLVESVAGTSRVGGTGSRLLSGQTEDWRELEERFAEFAGTEAALYFTTGYAANMGLLASLVGTDDVIYSDELNHASLIDGIRLSGARKVIYSHLDLEALELALRQDSGAPWRRVIVTETVFSMDGDVAPLRELAELAQKYGAALIVDEAHATGVHGPSGRGLAVAAGIAGQVLASVGHNSLVEARRQMDGFKADRAAFIEQWFSQISQDLITARNGRDGARAQLEKATKHQDLVRLTAPERAMVLTLAKLSVGSVLKEGDTLLTLTPMSAPLEAEAQVLSRDVGFIRPGDPVTMKIDAFNFAEHGTVEGKVKWISEDAFTTDDNGQATPAYYRVRVSVVAIHLIDVPSTFRLIPGMTLIADVKVGTRALGAYLIGGMMRGLGQAMREP